MDPLLRRFIDATTDGDAEQELDVIVEEHALPLAKAIVARQSFGRVRETARGVRRSRIETMWWPTQ